MDLEIMHLPPALRFCVLEILEEFINSQPNERHLTNMHEGFIYVHVKFVQLEKQLFMLGTSTDQRQQRKAAARVAAAALRILTDFTIEKEYKPCQKKRSTPSPSKNQKSSSTIDRHNATS